MKRAPIEAEFQFHDHVVEELSIKSTILKLLDEDQRTIEKIDIYKIETWEQDSLHIGEIGLSLCFVCSKEASADANITVEMKIVGAFFASITESMNAERFQEMLYTNGTAALYSIARAVIATTTAQCLVSGQVRIPMINVLEFLKSQPEEKKTEEENEEKS